MRSRPPRTVSRLRVVGGTRNVLIGIDLEGKGRKGCLGCSIRRTSLGPTGQPATRAAPPTFPTRADGQKLLAYGGGHSRIEFCDLYTADRRMVRVKRYEGSAPLSHLFRQGVVSAQLLLQDKKFRHDVNGLLPASHKLADPDDAPPPATSASSTRS